MASVVLSRSEATGGELPPVCVCCGDAARYYRRMALYGRNLGAVRGPLCAAHKHHWRWRTAVTSFALGMIPLMALGFVLMVEEIPEGRFGPGSVLWTACLLSFPVVTVVFFALLFTAVRVTWATKDTLTLVGVAPAFAEALRLRRPDSFVAR